MGSGLSTQAAIVAATGLSFPSQNVAKFSYDGNSNKNFQVVSGISSSGAVPAVGQYWFLRYYYRFAVPDGQDIGQAHFLQTHDILSWEFKHQQPSGGLFRFMVVLNAGGNVITNFYDNNFFAWLRQNTTYRVEMRVQRISASTGKLALRVYDGGNNLVGDNSTFVAFDNQGSLASRNPDMPVNDNSFVDFDLGNNDPDRSGVGDFYVGSMATRVSADAEGWIGPAQ